MKRATMLGALGAIILVGSLALQLPEPFIREAQQSGISQQSEDADLLLPIDPLTPDDSKQYNMLEVHLYSPFSQIAIQKS